MIPVKVATIGAWGHGIRVLEQLDNLPGVQVPAMAKALPDDDPSAWKTARAAAGASMFDDYQAMLREIRPDVVVISTRLDRIAPIALVAMRAGSHVICEKPLAITQDSLQGLKQAVAASGRYCVALLENATHPVITAARDAVDSGAIGQVVLVNVRKSYKWGDRPEWAGRHDLYGGTIPWVGIHGLDYIHAATGLTFTRAAAMQSNFAHPTHPDCEDNAVIILGLSNGANATMSLDLLRPAAAATHGDDYLRVVGTCGTIEAGLSTKRCVLTTQSAASHPLPLGEPVKYFRDLISGLPHNTAAWHSATDRSFMLTNAALHIRDAAGNGGVRSIPS